MRLLLAGPMCLLVLAGCGARAGSDPVPEGLFDSHRNVRLSRFGSERAFERYVRRSRDALEREMANQPTVMYDLEAAAPPPPDYAPPPIDPSPAAQATAAEEPPNPEITNNQTIGVDEGGIVKQVGRYLIVLQDGRLFSADLGSGEGGPLQLADQIDVYRSPQSAASWYDEILVHGSRVLVTAYNYHERASEISVFRIGEDGAFEREGRFLIGSDDYYSTENYSTRLVGDSLILHTPVALADYGTGSEFRLPQLRRADRDGAAGKTDELVRPADVYGPVGEIDYPVLHTISVCPLRGADLDCRTTAFVGGASREIYVSPTDAFLWLGAPDGLPWDIEYANQRRRQCREGEIAQDPGEHAAMLYRVPLGDGEIGAVGVEGVPADQFAFESRDGRFRALLARPSGACKRYDAPDPLGLLDIPLAAFGTRVRHIAAAAYTPLPQIEGGQLENRFIGDWLVYGGRTQWSSDPRASKPGPSALFTVPLAQPWRHTRLTIPHNALRIERAGSDAVVTGYRDGNGLALSYLSLGGAPRIAATTELSGRFESETRSHAFNAWMRSDGTGLIGLPTTARGERSGRGWSDSESSELSYVTIGRDRSLAHAGELGLKRREPAPGYRCEVSCVDWYGNSRPIFTGGRIFALMGTELVEGRLDGGRIGETGRLDLTGAPRLARAPAARPAPARAR